MDTLKRKVKKIFGNDSEEVVKKLTNIIRRLARYGNTAEEISQCVGLKVTRKEVWQAQRCKSV